jgi:predicted RNA methylase
MQAVVLAKTLHFLAEEGAFQLKGKAVLDLGCGVGFVGIYLACLGCQVVLADFPSLKDLVERNIGINKSLFRGKVDFTVANWY